jgi:ubiquinone/menaquinone biosynthesis C-methylase UbiE
MDYMAVVRLLLALVLLSVAFQIVLRIIRKTVHFPAPAFMGRLLDSGLRRAVQPPSTIIARSGIRHGMKVLEIGCGSGAYTTFVARAVGPAGTVYALDIQPAMLEQLKKKKLARPENADIRNVRPIEAGAYDIPLEDSSVDLAYTITVLQEIPDKAKALAEIKRVLKPGGIVAVTEFLPDPDYPLKSTVVRQLTDAGFRPEGVYGGHLAVHGQGDKAVISPAISSFSIRRTRGKPAL